VRNRLRQLVETRSVTGASLAIVHGDAVEVVSAGVRDATTGEPVDEGTVFDAASLTKPLVSYAVLQLADAGVLDLDEPLCGMAPRIVPGDPLSDRVTARHVLTHSCGLQNLRGKEPLRIYFAPGSRFSYSSVGFSYLQSALQARTGEPLEALLQRLVLQPLGMQSSSLQWQERFARNVAHPHEAFHRVDKHRPLLADASYSLQTTAADYALFVSAVLRGARLQPATWQQWLAPAMPVPKGLVVDVESVPGEPDAELAWGLGWGVERAHGTFFQWGKMTGLRAFVMGNPATRSAVVLLTNGNTGLRLMQDAAGAALPGAHPAIEWLAECVSE
jgi:CubicO group peptidase (beta-lactamase class C family)